MAEVKVRIGADPNPFKRGLDEMRNQVQSWATGIQNKIAGAFAAGAIVNFFNSFRAEMDRIGKLSTRLDISAEAVQRIGKAAELSGTSLEQVVKGMTNLTMQAVKGNDAFAQLGISQTEFAGADAQQQLLMLAKAYEDANGSKEKMLALMGLLGAKGQDVLPMLAQGYDSLKEQMEDVAVVNEQVVRAMEELNDKITKLVQKAKAAFGALIGIFQQVIAFKKEFFKDVGSAPWYAKAAVGMKALFDPKNYENGMLAIAELDKSAEEFAARQRKRASQTPLIDPDELRELERMQQQVAAEREKAEKTLRDRALARMDTEERIAALLAEQADHIERMENADLSELERVQAANEVLRIEGEIERARAEQQRADEAAQRERERAEAEIARAEAEIERAEAKVAAEEDRQALAAMDPAARAEELQRRQADLFARSAAAGEEGDRLQAAELRLAALELEEPIKRALADAMEEVVDEDTPEAVRERGNVVASTLAAIGGGGGAFVSAFDPQLRELQTQTNLLQQLVSGQAQRDTIMQRESAESQF